MEIKSDVDKNQKPYWPPGSKCRCKKQTKYIQPAIPKSFKPLAEYKKEGDPLSNDTIYKKSYKPFDLDDVSKARVLPIRPANSLMSAGDFQSDTTNKMSYGRWDGYQRSKKIPPKDHCLLGVGPLQEMTTNRHDYTPKYLNERTQSFKPPSWLGLSDKAMERSTTNNLSYAWPDQFEPTVSFRPEKRYIRPENKMESDSTQKMSYKPWDPSALRREKFPWQEKGKYNPPTVPMIGETIYNNSYFEPGRFEEVPACGNCYCLTIGECFDNEGNPPKAHEYTVCPIGYDPIRDGPRTPVTTT